MCDSECPRWLGRIRNASTRLTVITRISTIGTTRRICPISPLINASEPNTSSVVANEERTPGSTCPTPLTAASSGLSPLCRRAAMFSAITIASSISRPTPISRPTIEIMLIVMPSIGSTNSAPRKDTGRPMVTQKL